MAKDTNKNKRTAANPKAAEAVAEGKSPSKKRKSSSRSQKNKVDLTAVPFAPGTKVEVYVANDNDVSRREQTVPPGKPETTATVTKDGSLSISGLDYGTYIAVAEVETEAAQDNSPNVTPASKRAVSVVFTVKDDEAALKAKYEKYGGAKVA